MSGIYIDLKFNSQHRIMYFNRTLLFSIVLCVASTLTSSDLLEACTLEEHKFKCIGCGGHCMLSRQCYSGLTCSYTVNQADSRTKKRFKYILSDASVS